MIHLVDIDVERGETDLEVNENQQAMKEEGKYPKVSMCYVEGNDASRKLFEQFGFVEVSHPWDEIFMERLL